MSVRKRNEGAKVRGHRGTALPMATPRDRDRDRDRDRELLIPVGETLELDDGATLSSSSPIISTLPPSSLHHHHPPTGIEAFSMVIRSWASKKFMTGCVILFPIAITFYTTWWFIRFVDGFFSPIYTHLGINVFGLGFITSITFIFLVGVFMSSWLGTSLLSLGEWFIKKMPLVRLIYSASKQISIAISPGNKWCYTFLSSKGNKMSHAHLFPKFQLKLQYCADQSSRAFKEVVIIRHPRVGEYAIGFITSTVALNRSTGDEELSCVYVPTNHLYLGDIFLISSRDIIRPNLSVREGIEIIISGGMSIPKILSAVEVKTTLYETM